MRYSILLIVLLFVPLIHSINAQVPEDTSNCAVIRMNEIHTPFRVTLTHDLTIKKSITDQKSDPASALTLEGADQSGGGLDPATHLSFSSNSTDDWTITVNLDYKEDKPTPRIVIADFYQDKNQQLLISQKILSTGTHFCGVFVLHAEPAPHIYTQDEILQVAGKIEEEKFQQHDQVITDATSKIMGVGQSAGTVGLVSIIIVLAFIVIGLNERSFMRNYNKRAIEQFNKIEGTHNFMKTLALSSDIQNKLELQREKKIFDETIKLMTDIFNKNQHVLKDTLESFTHIMIQYMSSLKTENIPTTVEIPKPIEVEISTIDLDAFKEQTSDSKKKEPAPITAQDNQDVHPVVKAIEKIPKDKITELFFERKTNKTLEDQIKEFKKPEYKGKLFNIFTETYKRAKEKLDKGELNEESPESVILTAINEIVKENKGWP